MPFTFLSSMAISLNVDNVRAANDCWLIFCDFDWSAEPVWPILELFEIILYY